LRALLLFSISQSLDNGSLKKLFTMSIDSTNFAGNNTLNFDFTQADFNFEQADLSDAAENTQHFTQTTKYADNFSINNDDVLNVDQEAFSQWQQDIQNNLGPLNFSQGNAERNLAGSDSTTTATTSGSTTAQPDFNRPDVTLELHYYASAPSHEVYASTSDSANSKQIVQLIGNNISSQGDQDLNADGAVNNAAHPDDKNRIKTGEVIYSVGRGVVVGGTAIGATLASGGNILVGAAAGMAAGSVYDAIGAATQDYYSSSLEFDTHNSLGGLAVNSLKGEDVDTGDLARASFGSLTDGVNSAFAGQGVLSAKAAQVGVQTVAAQTGQQATRWELGNAAAQAGLFNNLAQIGTNFALDSTEIAFDNSLSLQQKGNELRQNAGQMLTELPGEMIFGTLSNHLGVSGQVQNQAVDKLLAQPTFAFGTALGQQAGNNLFEGEGFHLSQTDIAVAATQTMGDMVHNLSQREPVRTPEQVDDYIGVLHPYKGVAVPSFDGQFSGSALIVDTIQGTKLSTTAPDDFTIKKFALTGMQRSTASIWQPDGLGHRQIDWRQRSNQDVLPQPITTYRSFENALTGKRMFLEVDIDRQHQIGKRDQAALDKLFSDAGYQTLTLDGKPAFPVKPLTEETPSNILPATWDDKQALEGLKLVTLPGKIDTALSMVQPAPQKTLAGAAWLNHFLEGTGEPKIIPEHQVNAALPPELKDNKDTALFNLRLDESSVVFNPIISQINQGKTAGNVEVASPDHTWSADNSFYKSIGNAHFSAIYKGDWSLDSTTGQINFSGERRWLVQDRYNWQAKEFNGKNSVPFIRLHPSVTKAMNSVTPESYQNAFNSQKNDLSSNSSQHPRFEDHAMLGHLQMVQGGAQPFWTFGLGQPEQIQSSWIYDAPQNN
jgi:hypothetical protein